ncbi:cobalamin biosynthesis protein CbiX [Streptomyces sp. NPDC048565]|uniref:cobalamin biosynthesis protein CbiX n=1 Tax=Streptomyces sp. NPDC048565 TaxID=3155266 RepID=UPI00342C78FF
MADRHRVVAVYGHEAGDGEALRDLVGPEALVVRGGRELIRALAGLRRSGDMACVVPMTLGRDPELVADTARTLRALPAGQTTGTLLAEPFGTGGHLVARLRAAANRTPGTSALLVTAPTGGLFDDAELYRIARLVHGYGTHRLVEVALTGGDPDPAEGVRRCGLLGASRVTLLPAAFALTEVPAPGVPGVTVTSAGPVVSRAALARVLAERVTDARLRWNRSQDDGIATGLTAADDHGHSHTHPPGEGHGHGHSHSHTHPPGEEHGHGHDHGHSHPHPHAHTHVRGAGHLTRSTA